MNNLTTPVAAALGGHLIHVVVIAGALSLAAVVYGVATVTAPRPSSDDLTERSPKPDRPESEGHGHIAVERNRSAAVAQQLAFLGLCAAAGTHLAVMPDHFRQSWMYGAFFAAAAPLQLGLAWVVLVRPRRVELSAALAFSLGIVILWIVTRFVGVPIGPDNGATEELGVPDVFATVSELVAAAALVYLLARETARLGSRLSSAWRWSLWSPATRTMLAATFIAVPVLSAFASRS